MKKPKSSTPPLTKIKSPKLTPKNITQSVKKQNIERFYFPYGKPRPKVFLFSLKALKSFTYKFLQKVSQF